MRRFELPGSGLADDQQPGEPTEPHARGGGSLRS
jgi:hypothetical protein